MVERSVFSYRLEKDNHLLAFDKINLIKTIRLRRLDPGGFKTVQIIRSIFASNNGPLPA